MADKTSLHKVEIRYIPAALIGSLFFQAQRGKPEAFLDYKELELIDMPGFQGHRRPVTHPRNLDTIYKNYQRIEDTDDERTAQLKIRSMAVGDAIVYKNKAYYVVSERTATEMGHFATKDTEGNLVPVTEDNCV